MPELLCASGDDLVDAAGVTVEEGVIVTKEVMSTYSVVAASSASVPAASEGIPDEATTELAEAIMEVTVPLLGAADVTGACEVVSGRMIELAACASDCIGIVSTGGSWTVSVPPS